MLTNQRILRVGAAAAATLLIAACSSGTGDMTGTGGTGQGASATGGVTASGGRTSSGGGPGSGGIAATGGVPGTGGKVGSGGATATGGAGGSVLGSGGIGSGGIGSGGSAATGGSGGVAHGGSGGHAGAGGASGAGGSHAGTGGSGGAPATGGSTGSGGSGACSVPEPSALVGWATLSGGTTGGGSATPTTVTSLSAFTSAVGGTNAAVVIVQGKLDAGSVKVGSNKTIIGVCGAELHGHLEIAHASNVIVRNIKIVGYAVGNCALDPSYDSSTGCSSGNDAITVQYSDHVWFDHCDISDGTDGNLDIVHETNYVTVSWTKFHYTPRTDDQGSDSTGAAGHRFSNLIGGSDSNTADMGNLNITWHHNWWADNVVERQPRVRFGKNHLFNNLWTSSTANYCVRAGIDAQILLESNVFSGVKSPQEFNSSSDQATANITANSSNVYTNTSGTKDTGGGGPAYTSAGYPYTPDATSTLEAAIRSGAGPH
jgi:pectate lyase